MTSEAPRKIVRKKNKGTFAPNSEAAREAGRKGGKARSKKAQERRSRSRA